MLKNGDKLWKREQKIKTDCRMLRKYDKLSESMLNVEKVYYKLRKCVKSWESLLTAEKLWESVLKVDKVWESVLNVEKVR